MKNILSHITISIVVSILLFIGVNKYPLKQEFFINLEITPYEDVINYDNLVMQLKIKLEKEKFIHKVFFNRPKTSTEISQLMSKDKLYCCTLRLKINKEDFSGDKIKKIIHDVLDEFDEKTYKNKVKFQEKIYNKDNINNILISKNLSIIPATRLINLYDLDFGPVYHENKQQAALKRFSLAFILLINILYFGYFLKIRKLI